MPFLLCAVSLASRGYKASAEDAPRMTIQHIQQNIPAHRKSTDYGSANAEVIEQADEIVAAGSYGKRPMARLALPKPAQVRRNNAEPLANKVGLLIPPHLPAQSIPMNQDHSRPRTVIVISEGLALDYRFLGRWRFQGIEMPCSIKNCFKTHFIFSPP
jgi:hypothetical protein